MGEETTAVAVREQAGAVAERIDINSYVAQMDAMLKFCTMLKNSGAIPAHYKSAEAVMVAVLTGRELGFSPMRAVNSLYVTNGKAALDAQALKAMAVQAGGTFSAREWTDKSCTITATRGKWTEEYTFTIEDAEKMGLTQKDNWKRMPKAMLYARCVTVLIRNMFPDVTAGLRGREELEDESYLQQKREFETGPAKAQKPEAAASVSRYRYNLESLNPDLWDDAVKYLTENGASQVAGNPTLFESRVFLKRLEKYQVDYAVADVDEDTGEIKRVVAGNPELIDTSADARRQSILDSARQKVLEAKGK